LLGLTVTGLAGITIIAEWAAQALKLHKRRDMNVLTASWTLLRQQRRRFSGYLVHIGIVLMAVGIVGSRVHTFERDIKLPQEEPVNVGAYTLTYETLNQEPMADYLNISALISVARNGQSITKLQPSLRYYQMKEQSIRIPALRPSVREDLYVVLAGWSDNADTVTVQVTVNPLINFLWLGGLVFLAGGGFALWPTDRPAPLNVLAAVIGLGLLLGAGWAMWGIPHGVIRSRGGRPAVGQPAPPYELTLLDGSPLALEDLHGKVTVMMFWNAQCPVCKQTMPELQTLWETYSAQDVIVLGISVGDSQAAAQRVVEEMGTSYPTGLDMDGSIARRYGVTGVPEIFVLDRSGRVAYVYVGAGRTESLSSRLDQLLADPWEQ
jgi:cytochrome c-type biogenesis protein CcmF